MIENIILKPTESEIQNMGMFVQSVLENELHLNTGLIKVKKSWQIEINTKTA